MAQWRFGRKQCFQLLQLKFKFTFNEAIYVFHRFFAEREDFERMQLFAGLESGKVALLVPKSDQLTN